MGVLSVAGCSPGCARGRSGPCSPALCCGRCCRARVRALARRCSNRCPGKAPTTTTTAARPPPQRLTPLARRRGAARTGGPRQWARVGGARGRRSACAAHPRPLLFCVARRACDAVRLASPCGGAQVAGEGKRAAEPHAWSSSSAETGARTWWRLRVAAARGRGRLQTGRQRQRGRESELRARARQRTRARRARRRWCANNTSSPSSRCGEHRAALSRVMGPLRCGRLTRGGGVARALTCAAPPETYCGRGVLAPPRLGNRAGGAAAAAAAAADDDRASGGGGGGRGRCGGEPARIGGAVASGRAAASRRRASPRPREVAATSWGPPIAAPIRAERSRHRPRGAAGAPEWRRRRRCIPPRGAAAPAKAARGPARRRMWRATPLAPTSLARSSPPPAPRRAQTGTSRRTRTQGGRAASAHSSCWTPAWTRLQSRAVAARRGRRLLFTRSPHTPVSSSRPPRARSRWQPQPQRLSRRMEVGRRVASAVRRAAWRPRARTRTRLAS